MNPVIYTAIMVASMATISWLIRLLVLSSKKKKKEQKLLLMVPRIDTTDPFYLEACKEIDAMFPDHQPILPPAKPDYQPYYNSYGNQCQESYGRQGYQGFYGTQGYQGFYTLQGRQGCQGSVRLCTDCHLPITQENPGCSCGCDTHDKCMEKWSPTATVIGSNNKCLSEPATSIGSLEEVASDEEVDELREKFLNNRAWSFKRESRPTSRIPWVPRGPSVRYVKE